MRPAAPHLAHHGTRPWDDDPPAQPDVPPARALLINGVTQAEVLSRLRAGDMDALDLLYRSYFRPLWKFACVLTRSGETAEELLHDLFLLLWERRTTLDIRGDIGVYLQTAVRNRVYKQTRHAGVVRRAEAAATQADADIPGMGSVSHPDAELLATDEARRVAQALATLSDRDRQVLYLRWSDGRTFDDIATILGMSRTRVRVILARCQEKLRPLLEGGDR